MHVSTYSLHFSAWIQWGWFDSLASELFLAKVRLDVINFCFFLEGAHQNSLLPRRIQALAWRPRWSARTSSSVRTQNSTPSPARFASGRRRALFASRAHECSLRPQSLRLHGRRSFDSNDPAGQERVGEKSLHAYSAVLDACRSRGKDGFCAHWVRAPRGT